MILIQLFILRKTSIKAITIYPFIFYRDPSFLKSDTDLTHEIIHVYQQLEMMIVFFYLWYLFEWFSNIFVYGIKDAYKEISFEKEAYANESDFSYRHKREAYSFLKYL